MSRQHKVFALACLAAGAALGAAYSNHFDNAFHFDDSHVIVNNLAIRSLHDIPSFFSDPLTFSARPQNAAYRPLLTLSHAIDHAIGGGLKPRQFHRTQFGLLLLLGGLLVIFFRGLYDRTELTPWNRWIALAAATLFCIHTANSETVNYISARSSLVATLGVVGSFVIYLGWPTGRRWQLYLVPMLLGGLAKPLTVMFAPLLLLFLLLFEQERSLTSLLSRDGLRSFRSALLRSTPALLAGLALFAFLRRMDAETLEFSDLDTGRYARMQPYVWMHYARLFLLPRGLTVDTDWQSSGSWSDPRLLWGGVFVATLAAAVLWLSRAPRSRATAFGLAWFGVALLPTSSIFPLSEVYNEHRIFFPFVGLSAAAVWAVALGLRRFRRQAAARLVGLLLTVAVVAAHGVGTYVRNQAWRTPESLWGDVIVKSPRNARGQMNYALVLMRRGKMEQALEYFQRAEKLAPNYSVLQVNLGIVKSALGNSEAAEKHFKRALQLKPDDASGNFYYARWLIKHRRALEAGALLERSLAISPGNRDANRLLLELHAARGDRRALEAHARRVLQIAPSDPAAAAYLERRVPYEVDESTAEAYARLGRAKIRLEDWLAAAVLYRESLALDPRSAGSWNDLGRALANAGFNALAIPCFERATELDPELDRARAGPNRSR